MFISDLMGKIKIEQKHSPYHEDIINKNINQTKYNVKLWPFCQKCFVSDMWQGEFFYEVKRPAS